MNTGNQALLIARLDLRRRLRDRSVLLQVFIAPIVLALIVGGAFGGGSGSLDTKVLIADADATGTTQAIAQGIAAQSEDGGVVFLPRRVTSQAEAEQAVRDGEAGAAVFIPAGFTAAVNAGASAELRVIGSAADEITTSVAESVADGIAGDSQSRRVSIITATLTAQQTGQQLNDAALSAALQQPPLIAVGDSRLDSDFSLMSFFAPGMAMVFLFFVMGAAARSLLTERREGTLNRMLAGPTTPTAVLLGKAAAVVVLGMLGLLTVYLVTTLAFGVDWGDPVGVLLVMVAAVIAIAGISLIITGLARTEQQAEALTIVATMLFAVLGGTFVYTTSGVFAQLRAFTPNGQALMAFLDLAAGQAGWLDVLPRVLLLLAIGAVTGTIGLVAVRRGLAP